MHRESGISLLSVVVAVGISGILMVVVSKMLNQQRKVMNQIKWQQEKEDVRAVVRRTVNCLGTKCETQLKDLPEEVGPWHVRGDCEADGLLVEVRRYNRFGNPARHPLTEKSADWESLFSLSDPYLCMDSSGSSTPEASGEVEQYVPSYSPRQSPPASPQVRGVSESDLLKNIDPKMLEELKKRTDEALKNLCPPGQALVAIDTRSMSPVCE